ncbi:MAG: OmpH family outer membrane protein [Alphaproteobacteria bacterium]|nr:MAG: OmpH family outer membrane protein [Alphaproteobacteria bacterium]
MSPVSASRVGVVDYDKILSEATPFVDAAKVFSEKRDQFYKELGELEKTLSVENKALMSLRKSDPQKFPEAQEAFEKKLKAAHEKLSARKKTLVSLAEKEQSQAHMLFQKALKRVAEQNNIQLILPTNMMSTTFVLYSDQKLDLTNQVIAILGTKEAP